MIRYIDSDLITQDDLVPHDREGGGKERGVHTFIARSPQIEDYLQAIYGRDGLCLKVFKRPVDHDTPLKDAEWTDGYSLLDCTRAQNLFAYHGLAPRVYDIMRLEDCDVIWRFAQVTDYADGEGKFDREKFGWVRKRYGVNLRWDMNEHNEIGRWWVDFGAAKLADGYKDDLVKRAWERTAWGSRSEPYQDLGKLGQESQRDLGQRIVNLEWGHLNYLTGLDIGCSTGALCRWMARNGVVRVVGIDLPHVAEIAFEVANWHGDWNIDFIGARLPRDTDCLELVQDLTGFDAFDLVLALSVDRQIGYGRWMAELTGRTFYLEGHVPQKRHTFEDRLVRDFDEVEFLGMTRDHGPRPLFRCRRIT